MISYFDHVYSHALNDDLSGNLARFEKAGFKISPNKVRHPAGHYNGFIHLTKSYLELISIVDEDEFLTDAEDDDHYFRTQPQPFGVGAIASDPDFIFKKLVIDYPLMKMPYSRGAQDKPNGPALWTFAPLPHEATPGASIFALKYHSPTAATQEIRMGANTIFAFAGFYLCSNDISGDFRRWEETLTATVEFPYFGDDEAEVSFQKIQWITPERYQEMFEAKWVEHSIPNGKIAAIKLFAQDLELAVSSLQKADFELVFRNENEARFKKDKRSGYTFVLEQMEPDEVLWP